MTVKNFSRNRDKMFIPLPPSLSNHWPIPLCQSFTIETPTEYQIFPKHRERTPKTCRVFCMSTSVLLFSDPIHVSVSLPCHGALGLPSPLTDTCQTGYPVPPFPYPLSYTVHSSGLWRSERFPWCRQMDGVSVDDNVTLLCFRTTYSVAIVTKTVEYLPPRSTTR